MVNVAGFEPRTFDIGSNSSTNWATTAAPKYDQSSVEAQIVFYVHLANAIFLHSFKYTFQCNAFSIEILGQLFLWHLQVWQILFYIATNSTFPTFVKIHFSVQRYFHWNLGSTIL